MDNFWVEDPKKPFLMNSHGQALMEYILLISVISLMFISILRSDQFQDVFGEEANFFKQMRIKMAYEYRHGISRKKGNNDPTNNSYAGRHETYTNGSTTRFFITKKPYEK
tara:strand:+ start:1230 stop:1559 length:330 start_codon:yes stop_codon:yes gene_type:complete